MKDILENIKSNKRQDYSEIIISTVTISIMLSVIIINLENAMSIILNFLR